MVLWILVLFVYHLCFISKSFFIAHSKVWAFVSMTVSSGYAIFIFLISSSFICGLVVILFTMYMVYIRVYKSLESFLF